MLIVQIITLNLLKNHFVLDHSKKKCLFDPLSLTDVIISLEEALQLVLFGQVLVVKLNQQQ